MMTEQTIRCVLGARCGERAFAVELEANDEGLTGCRLLPADDVDSAAPEGNPHLAEACRQLREYFAGERTSFDVPLSTSGTDFQEQVWEAARQIPHGQTRSYWWIAVRIGNPHAMRAVGGALGANPLPIFTPCHRVLRQDGALGGFTGGIEWKQMLLALEERPTAVEAG
jgi:methylated-DNA-[protein]-cysteine S-methyltransferase